MAEDENRNQPHRSIDVTKPRESSSTPQSNIDASRVSAYTLREQQSLERLKKRVGNLNARESRAGQIKTIIAIVLVLILIALAVAFVIIIGRGTTPEQEVHDMRLSVQIDNKSALSIITETGQEQLREINPGDTIPLSARAMNSLDIRGDQAPEGSTPPAIYVRFRLVLVLDYEERYDIMIPKMSERWYKYDKEVENLFPGGGAPYDDHYYYLLDSLRFMEPEELFSEIKFDGNVLTCEDGGKYGQIQVHVECIEANLNNIISGTLWPTAPQGWVSEMVKGFTGEVESPETE